MEILFLVVGIAIGFLIGFILYRKNKNADTDTSVLEKQLVDLEKQKIVADTNFANAEKDKQMALLELKALREQFSVELKNEKEKQTSTEIALARSQEAMKAQEKNFIDLKNEINDLHKKYSSEFELLANKILEEKTNKFTEQNKNNLDIILNPLKEKLKDFEQKVEKAYQTETAERNSLKGQIDSLMNLNKQISEEASNLAKALKGENKTQGNWGEMILEKVLESSGLVKEKEYKIQNNVTTEEGKRFLPDVVVYLPDSRHIIIDSKVSLIDYERFVNADTEEQREISIKAHINSVKNHIKNLSDKSYQSLNNFNSPDFVLLFMPIESSFGIAIKADNDLFTYAWERKIVIVSPSTLLATLKTIESLWKNERQIKNHLDIAKTGGDLYDKFTAFVNDMVELGKKMDQGKKTYEDAMNKLSTGRGNVVNQIEKLKLLGVKANKDLPTQLIDRAKEEL
jgi:DNA recombination protein RmuC